LYRIIKMYKDFLNCVLTDGFKAFCEEKGAYWVFSDVASVLMCGETKKLKGEDFIILNLKVVEFDNFPNQAEIKLFRDSPFNKENLLYSQDYEYTDLKKGEYSFYVCKNELNTFTFMLKEEY